MSFPASVFGVEDPNAMPAENQLACPSHTPLISVVGGRSCDVCVSLSQPFGTAWAKCMSVWADVRWEPHPASHKAGLKV